tara:strand:- start:1077 stop:1385 length:309 start_codon:yes stop_codon:yes gene_type:complete
MNTPYIFVTLFMLLLLSCSPQEKPFHYVCDNGQTFDVVFNNSDEQQTADITIDGSTERLAITTSGSGSRYTGDKDNELWLKGNDAMFTLNTATPSTNCRTSD